MVEIRGRGIDSSPSAHSITSASVCSARTVPTPVEPSTRRTRTARAGLVADGNASRGGALTNRLRDSDAGGVGAVGAILGSGTPLTSALLVSLDLTSAGFVSVALFSATILTAAVRS